MQIEARYYEKLESLKIKCTLCPHECILLNNNIGLCKTRENKEGILYTNAYSNLCVLNLDPIEKKPLYHFYPNSKTLSIAIGGCNLKCKNCQNSHISQIKPDDIETIKLLPKQLVELAVRNNYKSISYTYTEPTVFFEYMLETAILAKEKNIKNILVSSGYINEEPLLELLKYLDAANIDLKYFDDNLYKTNSNGSLNPVLKTLKLLQQNNIWLEITHLLIPTISDNKEDFVNMCDWFIKNKFEYTPLHISRFFPSNKLIHFNQTEVDIMEKFYNIAKSKGLKYVYLGNIQNNIFSRTDCFNCNKTIIKRHRFEITENNLIGNKCKFCNQTVHGLF
jgi:pyruvate formate lyase activating enzyme